MTALRKNKIAIQVDRLERRQITEMNKRKHRAESKATKAYRRAQRKRL
jgi:hypothetical protein